MTSLGIELAKLTNPTPQILDSEDDENLDASMKKLSHDDNSDIFQTSELRSRTAPLLEDVDPAYTGRKVSRKSRGLIFNKTEDNVPQSEEVENESSDDNLSDLDSRNSSANDSLDEHDEEISDENISIFKQNLQNKSNSDIEDNEEESSDDSDDEETGKDEMISQFANIDVSSEIEKGKAIKAQQEIWNRLCEGRIKLQKLLLISNKLPQTDCYTQIKNEADTEMSELLSKGSVSLKNLLNSLVNLHVELCNKSAEADENVNDKEIQSSDDELASEEEDKNEIKIEKSVKRKCKNDDYSEILSKRFKSEKSNRNAIIQKWDEKVRLSTGRMTQKSFNAFDNSAVKQIEQILQDKNRLIKRTQLKRSVYRVLGKPEFLEEEKDETSKHENSASKQDMLLKDYDPQIFDDEDFYRQLLNDIIQGKYFGIDPSIVRKQMELQKIRNKMKRKVDTKASKGRRLRYDVHPQLVNYMAPIKTSTITNEARENMLKCLFGKALTCTEANDLK